MEINRAFYKTFMLVALWTAGLSCLAVAQQSTTSSPPTPPSFLSSNNTPASGASGCKKSTDSAAIIFSTKAMSAKWVSPDAAINDVPFSSCKVEVSIAKGETESASFVIRAEKELKNIRVTSIEFSSAPSPSTNIVIDTKLVKSWYQTLGAGQGVGRSLLSMTTNTGVLTPELLVNDLNLVQVDTKTKKNYLRNSSGGSNTYIDINSTKELEKERSVDHFYPEFQVSDAATLQPFSISTDSNQQVWLTITVNKLALPGQYIGKINLRSDDGALNSSIDINVKVRSYELPAPNLEYGIYYHGRLHESKVPTVSSEFKTIEQLKLDLRDIAFHGINFPVVYQDHNNKDLLLKYLQIMSDAGFSTKNLYLVYLNTGDAKTVTQLRNLEAQILRVKSICKAMGVEKLYIYGIDEAKGAQLISQKPAWEMVRRIGERTYVTGYQGTFEATGDLLDILVFANSPMKEEAAKYHSRGKKIFSYANPQSGVENPYIYRKNYGLLLWAADFDGALIYTYQHCMGECWNDFDNSYRDHNFTYPTANGFVGTIAWEGVREAIDDVRYVTLLEAKIKNVRDSNLTSKIPYVQQAEAYLNNIKNTLNKTNRYGEYSQPIDIDLDDIRENVVRYIALLDA